MVSVLPDATGHFDRFGGRFVPEALYAALQQLEREFRAAIADPAFRAEAERVDLPLRAMLGDDYRNAVLGTEGRLRELWKRRPWRDQ